jgi:dTDP-glucose 4,6-dehydratase
MYKKILVTGGAGFIGSSLIKALLRNKKYKVLNIDKLTYAGNLDSLKAVEKNLNYSFKKVDINNKKKINKLFKKFKPDYIYNLAAESHVDNSIDNPDDFIKTNILGTYTLLNISKDYFKKNKKFIFHHISTDEVYGELSKNSKETFDEQSLYKPNSPYAASKASSDHLVKAWYKTYDLPIIISNCSNNYGNYQYPEKLIPHVILNALKNKEIPVYGDGKQIRDWIHVDDHCDALIKIMKDGEPGKSYNVGASCQKTNIHVVKLILNCLSKIINERSKRKVSFNHLIKFVKDRPGHDFKYAINSGKIKKELKWKPAISFELGIYNTVKWYVNNVDWWEKILKKKYKLHRVGIAK